MIGVPRIMRRSLALLGALVLAWAPLAAHADDGEPTAQVSVQSTLAADGVLHVTQTLTVSEPIGEITQTFGLQGYRDESSYYRYEVGGFTATVDGTPVDLATTTRPGAVEVTATLDGAGPLVLSYEVGGATRSEQGQEGGLTFAQWPLLQGLPLAVNDFEAVVTGPSAPQLMYCSAGPPGALADCAVVVGGTADEPEPEFRDGPLDPGDEVMVGVAYPASAVAVTADVARLWSLDRAFSTSWLPVTVALVTAVAGGAALLLLHRRSGSDASVHRATQVAAFVPVGPGEGEFRVSDDIRPGHVGTVADERVDPIDITATLLDLAVRGHLRITEMPREHHAMLDWAIERRGDGEGLAGFEAELLDALGTGPVLVSRLPGRLAGRVDRIQDALYDDVVERGWFQRRPDATRSAWRTRGYATLVAASAAGVLLIAFTGYGLTALALVGLGTAFVSVADHMPRRTASGAALLGGLDALAELLATHPTDQMAHGGEQAGISGLLPYTVVLGGKERWLSALAATDEDLSAPDPTTLDWYHAPDTWHLQDLPASLTQFVHTVQGALYAR